MAFLTTSFGQLHYEFERNEHPALILSNSLGTDLSMWDPQVAQFSRHFSLLRMDTRGHGSSSTSPGPCSVADLGADVLLLLDHLGLERVYFCGLSMGGMVGQWLGLHAADRLHALVLSNTAAKIGTLETWNQRIALVASEGMSPVAASASDRWFTQNFRQNRPDAVEKAAQMLRNCDPQGYMRGCEVVRDANFHEDIHNVRTPALIVFGMEDPVTTAADARFIVERIDGAGTLSLRAAHLSNVEAADTFTNGVLNFLLACLKGGRHG